MMIQILLSVALMEETAVDYASTQITAQIVLVLEMSLEMEFLIPLLEMAIVMMKPTMVPVIMMLEIVVELSTLISVLSVIAILMSLVHLDHLLLQLEMDTAMMKPTSKNAYLMDKIVVASTIMTMVNIMIIMTTVSMLIPRYAQTVFVMVSSSNNALLIQKNVFRRLAA